MPFNNIIFHATTITGERPFSILWRLKTYLRNNIGKDCLTGLDLRNIHRNYKIHIDEVNFQEYLEKYILYHQNTLYKFEIHVFDLFIIMVFML